LFVGGARIGHPAEVPIEEAELQARLRFAAGKARFDGEGGGILEEGERFIELAFEAELLALGEEVVKGRGGRLGRSRGGLGRCGLSERKRARAEDGGQYGRDEEKKSESARPFHLTAY